MTDEHPWPPVPPNPWHPQRFYNHLPGNLPSTDRQPAKEPPVTTPEPAETKPLPPLPESVNQADNARPSSRLQRLKKPVRRPLRAWLIALGVVVVAIVAIGGIVAATETKLPDGPRSAKCVAAADVPLSLASGWIVPDRRSDAHAVGVWYLPSAEGRYTIVRLDNNVVLTLIDDAGTGKAPLSEESYRGAPVDKLTQDWIYGQMASNATSSSPGYTEARSCAAA